jgi:MoxR-like ATPase
MWDRYGVGKSQIVEQVVGDLDYEFPKVCAVQLDPADLRGPRRIEEDDANWESSKFLPWPEMHPVFRRTDFAPQLTQLSLSAARNYRRAQTQEG